MDPTTLRLIQGAAGAAASSLYVDDVFSTFLYEGNNTIRSINNGIDLSGEGGLVWIKGRDLVNDHRLYDTTRSTSPGPLSSNNSDAVVAISAGVTGFNDNGFSLGIDDSCNYINKNFVSWAFRKAPGFFTCVQYTGTGSNRTVAHDLGSTPGMIFVKCTNTAGTNWLVYNRGLGATKAEILDLTTGPVGPSANYWNNTAPTSTEFTVGISNDVNTDGDTYVAYLFAHDEPVFGTNEDESIIKCGTFTTNASGTLDAPVDLGFEPQFVLLHAATGGPWYIFDTMRGVGATNTVCHTLRPDSTAAELSRSAGSFAITNTGFDIGIFSLFGQSTEVPYMAIRRPNKPPSAATEVFSPTAYTGNQTARVVGTNFCDFAILSDLDATTPSWSSWAQYVFTRLLGPNGTIATSNSNNEATGWAAGDTQGDYFQFDVNNNNGLALTAVGNYMNNTGTNYALYNFTRSPGFMDVAVYTGTGSVATHVHNLTVVPELMLVKSRSASEQWAVYSSALGATKYLRLNNDSAETTASFMWDDTAPTSTVFTVGNYDGVNGSGTRYINYLFATLPGISKVGSYTGTGSDLNVDCGFSAGARFILIKRTDATGDWYVYDSARGIVSGNDPYVLLNDDAAQVTNTDYIDPLASGFTVTSSAPVGLNADGGTYIFLAIA